MLLEGICPRLALWNGVDWVKLICFGSINFGTGDIFAPSKESRLFGDWNDSVGTYDLIVVI